MWVIQFCFWERGAPMRGVFVCLGVWFLAASPVWGQFLTPFPTDGRAIIAYGDSGFQALEAERMMPFDAMLSVGTSPVSYGSAWQTSHVSQSEIFISGGTGEVLWKSTNENAGGQSIAVLVFGVDSPTQVRIRYELAIDAFSFDSWTGGAALDIAGANPIVGISASVVCQ
jgi:hypothetical protein